MPIAIANIINITEDTSNPGNPLLILSVSMLGGGTVKGVTVNVPFSLSDTPATVAGKATTAIVNGGAQFGFTLARTEVLLPSFVRGS